MTDEALVEQFQDGDRDSFDELVNRYEQKIYNLCCRFLNQNEDADDAAQEIFIKAYYSLDHFNRRARFSTWLYRIAVNHALNVQRSRRRKQWLRSLSMISKIENDKIIQVHDQTEDPHSRLEKKEEIERVRQALDRLPEEQRIIVYLHRFQELSYKEIADILGLRLSTVESRLFHAKKRLTKLLNVSLRPDYDHLTNRGQE
jgi:RNA polymerase sigma-70 factor (ECF subfamily)